MTIKSKILLPFLLLLSAFLLTPINAAAAPDSMEYQGVKLTLNGEGTRVRFFMKVYNTSLYLVSSNSNAEEILSTDEAMAIRLDVTSTMVTTDAMKDAMRARDKPRLSAIRLMLSEVKRIEVDERIEISDERLIAILDKMIKQRRDSITQYEAAGRQELADIEIGEISVIQEFLPVALTEDEISAMITAAISATGAESMRDMGKVMGILKPQIQGRADGGAVSGLVKSALNG